MNPYLIAAAAVGGVFLLANMDKSQGTLGSKIQFVDANGVTLIPHLAATWDEGIPGKKGELYTYSLPAWGGVGGNENPIASARFIPRSDGTISVQAAAIGFSTVHMVMNGNTVMTIDQPRGFTGNYTIQA